MRKFRHWTPRYVVNRLRLLAYERRHPDAPWLTANMVRILDSWLRPEDRGIEWGSGRSTIWFAERVHSLVSIENDPFWYRTVSDRLRRKGLSNVRYLFCEREEDYKRVAETVTPESLDFCLVDGEARDDCALAAISLLKPGGIVIVDNLNFYLPTDSHSPFSRRPRQGCYTPKWEHFHQRVSAWRHVWTSNGVFDTGFWVKPAPAADASQRSELLAPPVHAG